jgi:hypothetical protein
MNRQSDEAGRKVSRRDLLVGILVLGSVWGFFEVVLGGGMQAGEIPYKGDLMTGLGLGTMAVALAMYRKPLMLIGIAAIAVAVRQMAVPVLHLSFFCKTNSCLAMLLGGGALSGMAAVAGRRFHKGVLPRAATGFSAGLLAGSSFYFIGMRAAPCRYLLSFNRPGGFVAFLMAEGLIWAALSGILVPVGYRVGERARESVWAFQARRPVFYYLASAALIAGCWAASAVAIAGGL